MQLSLSFEARDEALIFVRHRRARRYILRVLDDGRVRVTIPRAGVLRDARAFAENNREWIEQQRARSRHTVRPAGRRPLRAYVERWQRAKATRELPSRLQELARTHGIEVQRVTVRDQRSRWGACSARGHITLNWRLILAPDSVRDYVLLHELMHRRELNHSRRFWKLMAECCPDYRAARRWLREHSLR